MFYLKASLRSLSDFVGFLQDVYKGINFGTLSVSLDRGGLRIQVGQYFPPVYPLDIESQIARYVQGDKVVFNPENLPTTIEDILDIVRLAFPGHSFQSLSMTTTNAVITVQAPVQIYPT